MTDGLVSKQTDAVESEIEENWYHKFSLECKNA